MTAPAALPARGGASAPRIVRLVAPFASVEPCELRRLFDRGADSEDSVRERVSGIIRRVRSDGDAALVELARELDGADLDSLEVPRARLDAALDTLDRRLVRALERAADNIASVHRAFMPVATEFSPEPGVVVGRRPDPLARVGVYAPGGRAAYPSSLLMGAIPARVAGVGEVVVCSPPARDRADPSKVVLAAAALAGVDRVFRVGGAGAIAAMAYGTGTIARVDRIVGPGNAWVAEAKLQVSRAVAIDSPAGPSELLVLALPGADAAAIARELMAQAEHDPEARVVLLALQRDIAIAVEAELARLVPDAERCDVISASLRAYGCLLWCDAEAELLSFAARYAAEHVLVAGRSMADVRRIAAQVRNAGTVFIGESSSNAFGDYVTGANHVLPTGGLARSWSGLSVLDFVRWTSWQRLERSAAAALAESVGILADAEGLPAHAAAARAWAGGAEQFDGRASVTSPGVGMLEAIGRDDVRALPLYSAAESDCEIDVSDNTSLWGAPPAALQALSALTEAPRDAGDRSSSHSISRYPAAYEGGLANAIRSYLGLPDIGVVTGCGSDDVLDAAMRAFASPGARIAFSVPTFSMIPVFAQLNALRPIAVPLRDDWSVDADALARTGAEIIYLCAPNNPTSTGISRPALEEVLSRAPGLVILDEAYAEFAAEQFVSLAARHPRLFVTRTLSKAFGLAGLRVGYGVGSPGLTSLVARARGPYKVSVAAERAAVAALGEGEAARGWVAARVCDAVASRDRLVGELAARGLECAPAQGNFVFVPSASAAGIFGALSRRGVRVRLHTGLASGPAALRSAGGSGLRVAAGPWPVMQRLLDALDGALEEVRR